MAEREIRVVIAGKEYVSGEAKKAGDAVEGLGSKVKAFGAAIAATVAGAALAKFFKDSILEAAKAEQGLVRLGVAVKNTGNDFNALKPALESTVKSVMAMSTATDDDLREALTRMIAISGDVEGSMKNLALVTDFAAFKNIDLETAAISLGKAMTGNTMELNRLGIAGTDATTVLENARASFGGFAAEQSKTFMGALQQINNQWGEFKEAVGVAILGGGQFTGMASGLATALGNLAGWVEQNEAAIGVFVGAVGGALSAVFGFASAIWDVVGPAVTFLAKTAFVGLVAGFQTLALVVGRVTGVFQEFAGNALISLGTLVEKGGKLLKVFGIEVVASTGESIRQYGEMLVTKSQTTLSGATKAFQDGMKRLSDLRAGTRSKDEAAEVKSVAVISAANKKGAKEIEVSHLDMEIARQKATQDTNELLAKTAELLKKQNLDVHAEQWLRIGNNVRRVKGDLSDLLPPVENLKVEIEKNNAALKQNAETAKEAKKEFQETADGAIRIGRGLIDAAQAAGVMDSEMASVLNSVLNVADNLAALSVDFSLGGLAGVVSGIASVISTVGGSNKELQKALDSNKAALERLSREVGNFNLGATGKTFQGTEKAIAAAQAAAGRLPGDANAGIKGKVARDAFRRELIRQGVSVEDAEQLIKDLGLGGALDSDAAFGKSLGHLSQGLKDTEFGQFGQDFESRFRSTTEGFGIFGTDKKGQFGELSALAGEFSPALAAALAGGDIKGNLQALFGQLKDGSLDATAFGDLSAPQFLDLIKELLALLEETEATPTTGGPTPGLDDKIKGLTGKAKNGLEIIGGFPPLPPLAPDVLGRLNLPTIPGINVPPLGGKLGLLGDKSGFGDQSQYKQEVAQLIQGDQIISFQITPRDAADPEEIAEVVAQRLGDRYTLQRQALGLT